MLGIRTGKEGWRERTESTFVLPVGGCRKNMLIKFGSLTIEVVQVVYHKASFFFSHAISSTVRQMTISVCIAKAPIKFVCF